MDPDKLLQEARSALEKYESLSKRHACDEDDLGRHEAAEIVADAFGALDEWLSTGGFLPEDWQVEGFRLKGE